MCIQETSLRYTNIKTQSAETDGTKWSAKSLESTAVSYKEEEEEEEEMPIKRQNT